MLGLFPLPIIHLLILLSPIWSAVLINAGFIGIAAEASLGRISPRWLVIPLAFYGGYWSVFISERFALYMLGTSFEAANERVAVEFDVERQAIAVRWPDHGSGPGGWLTANYALPVVYSIASDLPDGYFSTRLLDRDDCAKVREFIRDGAPHVILSQVLDGNSIGQRRGTNHFCTLTMPERPDLPLARVSYDRQARYNGTLPLEQVTATVAMPDGRNLQLLTGYASPLQLIPMPMVGCNLLSSRPEWLCVEFWRETRTPITSGITEYRREEETLALALVFKPVAAAQRRRADLEQVLRKLATNRDISRAR